MRASLTARGLGLVAVLALTAGACGGGNDGGGDTHAGAATTGATGATGATRPAPGGHRAPPPPEGSSGEPPHTAGQRGAAAATRAYVRAIDARDGVRLCRLLTADARRKARLPAGTSACADAARRRIGRGAAPGHPRWLGVRIASAPAVSGGQGTARVTLTVAERYTSKPPVSIEDDVVYLIGDGGVWRVAQPSLALYRALGVADVPPTALSPPPGQAGTGG